MAAPRIRTALAVETGKLRGWVWVVMDVQAIPGSAALATTQVPSSRFASAKVQRMLTSLERA